MPTLNHQKQNKKVLGVIPARYHSSRFMGKLLHLIGKTTVLQHVYDNVKTATKLDKLVIATDSNRIRDVAKDFGAEVYMTSMWPTSGTERIIELLNECVALQSYEIVVNIQGDEPLIRAGQINRLVTAIVNHDVKVASLCTPLSTVHDVMELYDRHTVKVVLDAQHHAVKFFRRSPKWELSELHKHIGVYAYDREFLMNTYSTLDLSGDSDTMLEQSRIINAGYTIQMVITKHDTIGVDTPWDLTCVRNAIAKKRHK